MPGCHGGDQLDEDYAPWAREKTKVEPIKKSASKNRTSKPSKKKKV